MLPHERKKASMDKETRREIASEVSALAYEIYEEIGSHLGHGERTEEACIQAAATIISLHYQPNPFDYLEESYSGKLGDSFAGFGIKVPKQEEGYYVGQEGGAEEGTGIDEGDGGNVIFLPPAPRRETT